MENPKQVNLGVIVHQKCDFCVKKGVPKTASKKGAPPDSNRSLLTCQEAPGEIASRAHCTDKKQLLEQQLKHCSTFLKKKWTGFKIGVEKLIVLLNRCKNMKGLLKTVDC